MGKVQSKQGDCFVVNAHFNPVCQLDESKSTPSSDAGSKRSNIGLSEMSLSISRDSIVMNQKMGLGEEKYPLKVLLPQESAVSSKVTKKLNLSSTKEEEEEGPQTEKAEEEKSEKEEKQKLKGRDKISCDVSCDDLGKQEFSFTLYDFNGHGKVTKDDVAGLVRSIYDALGKSVKLPPSGSRTIKVHLAVSPDADSNAQEDLVVPNDDYNPNPVNLFPVDKPVQVAKKAEDIAGSDPSVHTLSTYISSEVEKLCRQASECIQRCHNNNNNNINPSTCAGAAAPTVPQTSVFKKQHNDLVPNNIRDAQREPCKERIPYHRIQDLSKEMNDRPDPIPHRHKHHHKHQYNSTTNRDHAAECRERRNYLDLVGIENCTSKADPYHHHPCNSPYAIPQTMHQQTQNYMCPCRILDRGGHMCREGVIHEGVMHHQQEPKKMEAACSADKTNDLVSRFKTQFYEKQNNELLNMNFDLCDIAPGEKFDWECYHQHRRSKSYDMYDKKLELNSPRTKQKLFRQANGMSQPGRILPPQMDMHQVPSSPNHHYRHRHREREHQRAMQQVANWIKKEHLGGMDCEYASPRPAHRSPLNARKLEHHHLHEHVHHHYHHYIEN